MRPSLFLAGVLLLSPAAAYAQVTIDLRALDALPNGPGAAPAPVIVPKPAPRPAPKPAAPTRTATVTLPTPPVMPAPPAVAPPTVVAPTAAPSAATPPTAAPAVPPTAPAAAPAPPAATLPTGAPPVVALAPIPPPPAPAQAAPPAAPPVSASAGTTATPESAGLQLVFKPAESDLSPDANASVGQLVKATPTGDTISYNVIAYATGQADDPSVARRLSLARGLAVRSALIADGVASTRIYVRAMGSGGGGSGPQDRVDVTVMGLSGAAIPVKQ